MTTKILPRGVPLHKGELERQAGVVKGEQVESVKGSVYVVSMSGERGKRKRRYTKRQSNDGIVAELEKRVNMCHKRRRRKHDVRLVAVSRPAKKRGRDSEETEKKGKKPIIAEKALQM